MHPCDRLVSALGAGPIRLLKHGCRSSLAACSVLVLASYCRTLPTASNFGSTARHVPNVPWLLFRVDLVYVKTWSASGRHALVDDFRTLSVRLSIPEFAHPRGSFHFSEAASGRKTVG